jgi:hypothetical protein
MLSTIKASFPELPKAQNSNMDLGKAVHAGLMEFGLALLYYSNAEKVPDLEGLVKTYEANLVLKIAPFLPKEGQ